MKKLICIIVAILAIVSCSLNVTTYSNDFEILKPVTLYVTPSGVCQAANNVYFNLTAKQNLNILPSTYNVSYSFETDDCTMHNVMLNDWPMYKGTLENVEFNNRNHFKDGVYYTVEDDAGIRIAIIRADIGLDKILHDEDAYAVEILRDMVVVSFDRELNKSLIEE